MNGKSKPIEDVLEELLTLDVPALVARYIALHGRRPRTKNRVWLYRRCAWKEQEIRFGGLSTVARKRIEELQSELDLFALLGDRPAPKKPTPGDVPFGTRLERSWRGHRYVVIRTTNGWELEGAVHRSLSAAANAITGGHVSGPAFFGLRGARSSR